MENDLFYFSTKTYVVGTQKNHLNEMILLSTQNMFKLMGKRKPDLDLCHNICFTGEIRKRVILIPQALVNPFKPNGISHYYQLDQSISVLRVVGRYFIFLLEFQ